MSDVIFSARRKLCWSDKQRNCEFQTPLVAIAIFVIEKGCSGLAKCCREIGDELRGFVL
jgi:hypothetical protein